MENPTDKQEPQVGAPVPPPPLPEEAEEAAEAAGQNDANAGEAEDRGDTLAAWIQRAKRAHELVDAVDLNKVAEHDAEEVAKVGDVADALGELESGHAVDHVDGVDEIQPEIDARHQVLEALFELLSNAGWSDRIGRVLHAVKGEENLKPMEMIPHQEGLPEFSICVAPEQCVGNGNFGLFISESGLFAASIADPVTKHRWRIFRSRPYDNHDELLGALKQFSLTAFE